MLTYTSTPPKKNPVRFSSTASDRELKIYELVLKRFLAVLLPPYLYEQTTINAIVNQEIFTVSGKIETQIGWKEVYGHEEIVKIKHYHH